MYDIHFKDESINTVNASRRSRRPKAKFAMGRTARIHFPYVNPDTGEVLTRRVEFYKWDNNRFIGGFFVPPDTALQAKLTAILGPPQVRWVTPVLIYKTDDNGNINPKSFDFQVTVLTMDSKKVVLIKGMAADYKLSNTDFKVMCQDEKFQALQFMPLNQCVIRELMNKDTSGATAAKVKEGLESVLPLMHETIALMPTEEDIHRALSGGGRNNQNQQGQQGQAPQQQGQQTPSGQTYSQGNWGGQAPGQAHGTMDTGIDVADLLVSNPS